MSNKTGKTPHVIALDYYRSPSNKHNMRSYHGTEGDEARIEDAEVFSSRNEVLKAKEELEASGIYGTQLLKIVPVMLVEVAGDETPGEEGQQCIESQ